MANVFMSSLAKIEMDTVDIVQNCIHRAVDNRIVNDFCVRPVVKIIWSLCLIIAYDTK